MLDFKNSAKLFEKSISKYEKNPALIWSEGALSYGQFHQSVLSTAGRLNQFGLEPGERIALKLRNSPEFVILLWAVWYAGGVAVPVSFRWPDKQISEALRRIRCRKIILNKASALSGIFNQFKVGFSRELVSFSRRVESGHVHVSDTAKPDDDCTIIFTSGSSGAPRAAVHSLKNHYYSALGSQQNIKLQPGHRWLLSLPLFHVGGIAILFRTMLGGAAVVIPSNNQSMAKTIIQLKPTHLSLVTAQLRELLQEGEGFIRQFTGLKAILLGGSAIPEALIERAYHAGLPVFTSYGSTEMASQITTTPPEADLKTLKTSGKVLLYRQIRISDAGEILVKGETLFKGYLENNQIGRKSVGDGWFPTGDLGKLDEVNRLQVTGRRDNLFISGGENIQPEEIETALLHIEGILEAVVVAVPDERYGRRPVAFLKLERGQSIPGSVISEDLKEQISKFKIPDFYFELPEDTKPGLKQDRKRLEKLAGEKLQAIKQNKSD